jgi:hypothetical protein
MNGPRDNRACDGPSCDSTFFVDGIATHPTIPGDTERPRQLFCSERCKHKAEVKAEVKAELEFFLAIPFSVKYQSKVTRLGQPTHSGVVHAQELRIHLSV